MSLSSRSMTLLLLGVLPMVQAMLIPNTPVVLGANQTMNGKPLMMLAMGPTGSGKTGQEEQLQWLYNLETDRLIKSPPKMLLVDEWIEKDATYRKNILEYLRKQLGASPSIQKVDSWVTHAGKDVYDYFAEQYFGSREHWGCNMAGKGGCKQAFTDSMKQDFKKGENVIYEATGKKYPTKQIELASKSGSDYEVVVGVNAVEFCELKRRNSGRASGAIVDFMKNPSNLNVPAPRLPDLSDLSGAVSGIIKSVQNIIDCVGQPISKTCPGKVDRLYVFDNDNGFQYRPAIVVKVPSTSNAEAQKALKELQKQAKRLIDHMTPRSCPSVLV